MSSIDTTTATAVRELLISNIRRIKPRLQPRSVGGEGRWKHLGDLARAEITGRDMREFQVNLEPETEAKNADVNAYSGGLTLKSLTTIVIGYPLTKQEMHRAAGADMTDLTLMLYGIHTQLPGMMPVQVQGRERELMSAANIQMREHGYVAVVTILPGLHWFASDEVEQYPEGS